MIPDLSIPIVVLLIPYGLFVLFYTIYALFNIYHLMRFGVYNLGSYLIITIFLGGTVFLFGASFMLLAPYDWFALWSMTDIFQANLSTDYFPGL
jgi:hypothetical protein